MALRITRKPTDYISETAFMYDVAQTSKYFDKSVYQGLSALGDQDGVKQYLYGLAGYKDKDATAFNQTDYDYLQSPEDKASYVLYKLSGETDADTDAYFEYKIQEAIDKQTYESLNWFEKTAATVGGILGNVLNETLLGTTEGLIDTLALGFGTTAKLFTGDDAGAKQFMTKDITGVAENRADLQKFARKYTYIDKNGFAKGVNDVAVALGQMLPLALNIVAPGVGTVVYTSAMAGNAAANAVEANPDIDYLALNGYYFGMVGLSLATGKISQKILGGSGNLIDDLMYGSSKTATTKIGEFASKNLATKLGFSFLSEGLEESIEEFADVVLYNTLVAKNDLKLEQEYSIKEILYAGLIGGLVGGLADSVGIAFTKKSVLTEDGRVMTKAEAERLNLKVKKELSKFETISFNDRIQQAQALLETNLDARADLLNKYSDLTEAQIQEQHYTEYMEALEKNEKIKSKSNEVILGLSKILDLVGEESFVKAVDLANTTLETQQRLMDDYVAKATGKTAKHIEIAEKFKKQYPTSSITITDTPTAQQKRLIQNMKNAYGIDVYFGTIGEKNGRAINYAVTLDENTIVIDEKQASNLSEQALLNEVVKEELVHTIQFTKNLITPRLLAEIQYAMGNTEFAKQTLNAGYDLDTPLNQISEAQAKAVAQVLLFDNLTVSKMFYTQYSTLNGVYKKFLDIKNWLLEAKELRSQKGKMKFNMLLKSMKMYRDIAAEKLGTAENVEQFIEDYQLTELEQKQLRDAYLENPEIGPIEGYAEEAYSKQEQQSQEIRELLYNEDGTPKTFYKGGNTKGITEFNALAGEKYRTSDKTAWVSDSLVVSKSYSNEKQPDATIYSLDLTQISNPKIIDAKGAFWNNIDGKTTNQLVDEAIAENKGYDAVIIKNVIDPGTYSTDRALANPATSVAVIDPSKIKIVSESPRNEISAKKTINPKKIKESLQQTDNEASVLKYLNEYFADARQKLSISFRNGNYHVFSATSKAETPRDKYTFNNVTDMLNTLQNDGLITENMMTKMSEVLAKGEPDGTFQVETPQGQQLILTGSYERAVPTHLSESSIAYAQTEIFDNIDPNMSEDTRLRTINKAIEQENLALKNRVNITNDRMQSKLDELLKLFDNLDVSAFQGKVNDPKVERVSNELFNEHPEAFLDITSTEFVALKDYAVVRIGEGPVYGALTNSLIRYAWLNRFDQFADIQEYVETLYSEWIATGAQAIGLTSSDYETTISHFMKQMALEKGVLEIKLPSELFLKTIPDFKIADDLATITKQDIDKITEELKTSKNKKPLEAKQKAKKELLDAISSKNNVKIFEASLGVEILDLSDKLKNTKDPLDQRDIREQILNKKIIKAALSADDIGKAIDYQLKSKFEEGTDISQTLQMRNDIYEAIVAHLIKHAEIKGDSVVGVNSKKIPDSKAMEKAKKFFMSVESFRYLMMLSNPATSVKNGAANALMFCQSFVEDGALHLYEKSNWLLPQAAQAKFVGDYDENFKNYVKEMSWEKIKDDCEGDKYTTEEFKKLQRKYAEATDPLKKSKLLTKIQEMERKGLSDTWAVSRRTLLNFTNTLAGSSDLILSYSIDYLKTKYFNRNELAELQTTKTSVEARQKALIDKIAKTNKPVSDLLTQAIAGDKIAILKIANVANLDIVKPDLKIKNSIYYKSFERANKTFLKTDNYFTELLNKVKKDRPAAGWVINKLIPFARVATNSLLYIVDRSPIGFAKGVYDMFKTRRKWTFEMREAIDGFYMQRYIAEKTSLNKDEKVDMSGYKLWFETLSDHDDISASKLKQAMNGDDKATREIFEQMVEQGWVSREQIGSNDIFARGDIAEKLAQGSVGTGMMSIGLILGALLDFEYDEDDYLGPVINCKYFKLQLNTLSPITTLITMPAMLFSDVDNKYEKIFEIFADATILSTFDSALSYSDSLWDYIKNQSINIASQYQPAFTKAIAKVFYNKKKDKGSAYWTRLINSMMANSLIFNSLVPNKINPYTGEAEKHYDAGIWEGLLNMVLPLGLRTTSNDPFEREAMRLKAESDGFSGSFTINETDIKLTGKDKQKYATHKAKYISERFDNIYNGREKVTVKDEKTGKFKTVTYDKLTDKEKQKVLKNLYTTGTTVTKIQYWLDKGNSYVVTDRNQYYDYKKLFGNSAKIVYKNKWSTSKFVEG